MINSHVRFYTGLYNDSFVSIGRNTKIGFNVSLITVTHEIGQSNCRGGECVAKSITIGDGVWICANSTILPGVSIADGCIIAAGAVVTKSTEPNGMYAGVPARRIKELKDEKYIGQQNL